MKIPFFNDTSGKPSASLTLSLIAFSLVALWFLLSFINIKIAGWQPREFQEVPAIAFLTPCLFLYFNRRKAVDGGTDSHSDETSSK